MPQPQLDHNQSYFHVSIRVSINHSLIVAHHLRDLMVRNGDLTHKGDSLNTEDHHQAAITGEDREVQQEVKSFTVSCS